MARPVRVSVALAAASVNNIAQAQSVSGAGSFTLNGTTVSNGVAILDTPRRVLITSAGNDSGITFTVTGNQKTDGTGNIISQAVTGANIGAVATTLNFGQVTSITASGSTASTVQVGTNTVGSSPWFMVSQHSQPVNQIISVTVVPTVNYTVEYTYDDPFFTQSPNYSANPTVWADPVLTAATANGETTFNDPIQAWRLTVNSGTGTATATGIQAGIKG